MVTQVWLSQEAAAGPTCPDQLLPGAGPEAPEAGRAHLSGDLKLQGGNAGGKRGRGLLSLSSVPGRVPAW